MVVGGSGEVRPLGIIGTGLSIFGDVLSSFSAAVCEPHPSSSALTDS
jgi:hypothetical protein